MEFEFDGKIYKFLVISTPREGLQCQIELLELSTDLVQICVSYEYI